MPGTPYAQGLSHCQGRHPLSTPPAPPAQPCRRASKRACSHTKLPPLRVAPASSPEPSGQQCDSRISPGPQLIEANSWSGRRLGHSNGHHTNKRSIGRVAQAATVSSDVVGSSGGVNFRTGAGQLTFRRPLQPPTGLSPVPSALSTATASTSIAHSSATGPRGSGSTRFRQPNAANGGVGWASFQSSNGGHLAPSSHLTVSATSSGASNSSSGDVGNQGASTAQQASISGAEGSDSEKAPAPAQGKTATDLLQQLQSLGLAGVVAYGLLNTLYYTAVFSVVWMASKVPKGQGPAAAMQSFLTVMAMVWAGSQVTKVARAAGALVLAPIVDRGLTWMQARFNLASKKQAFLWVLAVCISVALTLFGTVVLAWA